MLGAASLGLKLNLALLAFFVLLGAATSVIVVYGFNRTQDNANERSQEALEEIGKLALRAFVAGATENGGIQFEAASEIGQRAARQMESFHRTGASVPFDSTALTRTEGGLYYDGDFSRTSDFIVLPFASLDSAAVQDEIAYGAALDAIFESVFEGFEDEVGGRNFDPSAIGFIGANGTGRYYPPRGIHEIIPPDLDISGLLERAGPSNNPTRRTTWTRPYEDAIGLGLVVTAETPVYEGDTFRGVIQVDLSIDRLVRQIDSIHPTPGGFAFYLDTQGDQLRSGSFDLLTRESEQNRELAAVLAGMTASDEIVEPAVAQAMLGGQAFFIAYAPMPSLGGSFAVAAPISEITADAAAITAGVEVEGTRTLWAMLAAMCALFLAGLVAAGYLNRRILLSPISALLRGTRAVGAGDLETAIPVGSRDELGHLAAGFNAMVDDLRTRSASLEREVAEREEAQGELAALFAAMDDVVIVFDRDGRCVRVAPTNPDLLYAPAADVEGRKLQEFMPKEQADLFLNAIHACLETEARQTIEYPMDVPTGERWFSAAITPMGAERVVYVARDVTEREQAAQLLERRVVERTRELNALLDVSRDVASTLDLQDLATRVLTQLRLIVPCDGAAILLVEEDSAVILETNGRIEIDRGPLAGRRLPLPVPGPGGEAIERRAPVVVSDVESKWLSTEGALDLPLSIPGARSWLAVPLIAQDHVVGVLTLWSALPGLYGREHTELAMALASQAAVAIDNARLYQQASSVAALEERQRLARELHDSVSQALYGIALGAQTARQLLDSDPKQAIPPVDYVVSLAEAGLAEMRALIFELRPESLAAEGLVSALEKQAAAIRARYDLEVVTSLSPEPDVPLDVKEALYRIAQEAMHNSIKHARAHRIRLLLQTAESTLRLEATDDGIGFDVDGDFPGHLGLRSINERAASIGGSVSVESSPGNGCRVAVRVPRA
ncbi:MAG: histidine kinase [Dehalococcoidia bacterium]